MSEYLSARQAASRIISKKGAPVVLKRTVSAGYDPVTQTATVIESDFRFDAVALPPASARKFGVDLEGRDAVELYFAHGDEVQTVPMPGDTVTIAGKVMTLFWTQTYDPAQDGAVLTVAFAEAKAA